MSRSVLTATVLLASAAMAGCSSWAEPAATPPPTFTVTGAVVLPLDFGSPSTSACVGEGLHSDVTSAAQVVIRDGDGKLAGVGQLGAGVEDAVVGTCSFPLTVAEVSNGRPFYTVEVAQRGQTYYTAANIRKPLLITLR